MPDNPMLALLRDCQIQVLSGLWVVGAALLIFASMGYASGRVLRRMPDFPEKAAMLRGARWGALVMTGLMLLQLGIVLLGMQFALMMLSGSVAKAVFWAGLGVFLLRFRLESDGMTFGLQYWRHRKQAPDKLIEDWRKRQTRVERYNRICLYCWPVLCGLWLAIGGWGYWHFDRSFVAAVSDERLGMALKQELNDPRVVKVMPMHAHFEGPLYPLITYVLPQTSVQQGWQIARQTQRILAQRSERLAMSIYVRPEHGHVLARATYVPFGMTLPAGGERQHPHPRKW